ncbi:MAG: hypothetical protein ABI560_16715, partial [Myxococcales bacterium]
MAALAVCGAPGGGRRHQDGFSDCGPGYREPDFPQQTSQLGPGRRLCHGARSPIRRSCLEGRGPARDDDNIELVIRDRGTQRALAYVPAATSWTNVLDQV